MAADGGEPRVLFFTMAAVIVDDLVLTSGESHFGLLGGGASHALLGMCLSLPTAQRAHAGIVAKVGSDLPASLRHVFTSSGADLTGLRTVDHPQPRGTSVFHAVGPRSFKMQDDESYRTYFRTRASDVPDAFVHSARGVHLLHSPEATVDVAVALRGRGFRGEIMAEPGPFYYNPEHRHLFEAMLRHIDVFSPNHEEAAQLLGAPVTPEALNIPEVVRQLMDMGTRILALRCGAHGSVVACRNPEGLIRFCRVPIVTMVQVADETGCGNTYCGAFLATYVMLAEVPLEDRLQRAAAAGSVAASFTVERVGPLCLEECKEDQYNARLQQVMPQCTWETLQ